MGDNPKWVEIQKKTFTKWSNNHLRRRYGSSIEPIKEIQDELDDGIYVFKLIHALYDTKMPKYNAKPKMRPHKLDNISLALKMIEDAGIKTHFLKPGHLADHDLKMVLGMIWTIILDYQIKGISVEELSAKEGLLRWCQKCTASYDNVDIVNFHTSWQDGLGFCALIHRHRPDLIQYDQLSKDDPAKNLQLAFDVAEKELGIPKLLDVEDLTDVPRPDERSVMTYVSEYFHCFASQNQQEIAGRRIAKVVSFARTTEEMKAEYSASAKSLIDWITATTDKLANSELDNTLAGVNAKIAEYAKYKSDERPPKTKEKLDVETKFNNIAIKLRSNDRPEYVPEDGLSVADVQSAWDKLEAAESAHAAALEAELVRQERLEALANRFNTKAGLLTKFSTGKSNVLESQSGQTFSTAGQVQVNLQMLDAFDQDLEGSKSRLKVAQDLAAQITADNYRDSDAIQAKSDELGNAWTRIQEASAARREALEAELKKQGQQDDKRQEFAREAKAFERFLKDACESARDHTSFGDTLDDVKAYESTLDSEEKEVLGQSDSKRAALDALAAELTELGVTDNQYTHITVDDIGARQDTLKQLLSARREAYAAELANQEAMEAKRLEFAGVANDFVSYLAGERSAISAVEGEPEESIEKVNSLFKEQEADDKLAAVSALDEEMRGMGIVFNRHTNLSVPTLAARLAAYKAFVKHTLEDLEQSLALKQKAAENRKEAERQQQLEDMKIEFAKRAAVFSVHLQNDNEVISEPIAVNSVEAAKELQAAYDACVAEFPAHEELKNGLVAYNEELVAAGITENPISEMTAEEASASWDALQAAAAERKEALAAEVARQEANEALRVQFAEAATAASQEVDTKLAQVQSTDGDVAAQLEALGGLNLDASSLEKAGDLAKQLDQAGVRDNKHTNLTYADLEAKATSLKNAVADKRKVLEAELLAKEHGQVPPEQLQEINECFAQFDKDSSGTLVPHEFKACLSALGEAITEEAMHALTQQYGDEEGRITLPKFTEFMISRLADNDTKEQILTSFRVLSGDKDYVTEMQLRTAFGQDQDSLNYILANIEPKEGVEGGLDFEAFVSKCYA